MTRNRQDDLATTATCEQIVPAWVASMRSAAMGVLKQPDIEEIVRNQITAAKGGDKNAIRFVFEQVLGGQYLKGAAFVQNNYGADMSEPPARSSKAMPLPRGGDSVEERAARVAAMARRAQAGQPLVQDGDDEEADLA